jgi:hypothetical protein
MPFLQYGLITAADYNVYVGPEPGATANALNTVWGTGNGRSGYGQPPVTQVAVGTSVSSSQWNGLITSISRAANHQGTVVTRMTTTATGGLVAVQSGTPAAAFAGNLSKIYTSRNQAIAQGTSYSVNTVASRTWMDQMVFVHTITFETGDKARYFFNAGGQIAINFNHPNGSGVNGLWNNLATACGTIVVSAPFSDIVRIAGTDYYGITKIGGSGTPRVLVPTSGYYSLNANYREVFKQVAATGSYMYLNSYISVNIRSNGTRGTNGDMGNIITIVTKFDQVPDGSSRMMTSAGTNVTISVRPPSTTYLANSWGTPVIAGQVGTASTPGYLR